MKKSELKNIIKEEILKLNEKSNLRSRHLAMEIEYHARSKGISKPVPYGIFKEAVNICIARMYSSDKKLCTCAENEPLNEQQSLPQPKYDPMVFDKTTEAINGIDDIISKLRLIEINEGPIIDHLKEAQTQIITIRSNNSY